MTLRTTSSIAPSPATEAHATAAGYLAALAGFERMTTTRLRALLRLAPPDDVYAMLAADSPMSPGVAAIVTRSRTKPGRPTLADTWRAEAARRDPASCAQRCEDTGVSVLATDHPDFPQQLLHDPACPAVLFTRGRLDALDGRRVGVVGTRNASQRGRQTAAQFGHELAEHEVAVVSGLARGIDGAAHRGAVAAGGAPPIGVVGCGLDRPYPREHTKLWESIATDGLLLSEWPPGTGPDAFRFPLRNRILAALIEVLVVVESRERGGSLITVREAQDRGVEVMAVPGSVHSRCAEGTNELIRCGALTALHTADILMALSLDHRRVGPARFDSRPLPRGEAAEVLAMVRDEPRTLDAVVLLSGLDLGAAALTLARLERDGWVREAAGWFEEIDTWADLA